MPNLSLQVSMVASFLEKVAQIDWAGVASLALQRHYDKEPEVEPLLELGMEEEHEVD